MIKNISHIGLYTDKFDETIAFYKSAFDAKVQGEFYTDKRGVWLLFGDSVLEIFESTKMPEGSFKHIALACDSVDESYKKALSCGAQSHLEPKNIVLNMEEPKNLRIAFVKGVNGEQIELCEELTSNRP